MKSRGTAKALAVLVLASVLVGASACTSEKKATITAPCLAPPRPGVEWQKCQLRGADLRNAQLKGAFIHNADLSGADLTGADLSEASVANTEFKDAILFDANLRDTLFSGGDIHLGKFCRTTMPTGKIASGGC